MPIFRAVRTISSLSIPTRGRNTGRVHTWPVTAMASMVWLATWPRDSPVISPWAPTRWATRSEMRIMNRRISRVKRASGQWSRSCS